MELKPAGSACVRQQQRQYEEWPLTRAGEPRGNQRPSNLNKKARGSPQALPL